MAQTRNSCITIRVSAAERKAITERARSVGMTLSAYLRKMGQSGFVRARLTDTDRERLGTLGALRSDIARLTNALSGLSPGQRMQIFRSTDFVEKWVVKVNRALDFIDRFIDEKTQQ